MPIHISFRLADFSISGITSRAIVFASSWQKNHPKDLKQIKIALSLSDHKLLIGVDEPSIAFRTSIFLIDENSGETIEVSCKRNMLFFFAFIFRLGMRNAFDPCNKIDSINDKIQD